MPSVKDQLTKAQEHLKAKEYGKARAILEKIDHPTARKWLVKLDEIAPVKVSTSNKRYTARRSLLLLVAVPVTPIAIVAVFLFADKFINGESRAVEERLFSYCSHDRFAYDDYDLSDCSDWAASAMVDYGDTAFACHRQSPVLEAPFNECMDAESVFVPSSPSRKTTLTAIYVRNETLEIEATQAAAEEETAFWAEFDITNTAFEAMMLEYTRTGQAYDAARTETRMKFTQDAANRDADSTAFWITSTAEWLNLYASETADWATFNITLTAIANSP